MGANGMTPASASAGMHLGMGAAAGAAACASATFQQVQLYTHGMPCGSESCQVQ